MILNFFNSNFNATGPCMFLADSMALKNNDTVTPVVYSDQQLGNVCYSPGFDNQHESSTKSVACIT